MSTIVPLHDAGRVSRVRVFIDRAAVTRAKTLAAPVRELVFQPIPLDAETATLRAEAKLGEASLRVSGVVWTVIHDDQRGRGEELKAELESVRAALEALDDLDAAESHNAQLLTTFASIATDTISRDWLEREPTFDKWTATLNQLRARHASLAISRAERQVRRQALNQRNAELLAREYQLGHHERVGYRVTVSVELPAGASGPLSVELTYLTKKAQWMPIYDARHLAGPKDKERLSLTGIALVRQSTGEDWTDVELIATTARPPLSEPPPELKPLFVLGHQGGEQREVISSTVEQARLAGGRAPPGPELEVSVEHKAPGKVSIPATGRPVRVELFSSELPCRTRLEVAPRERPVAILVAELDNRTGRVLLPGRVNVFRGPNYAGQARIGFVAAHERIRLALGTEATVRIKRDVNVHPEKKAVLGASTTHLFESRTIVENLGQSSLEVLLRDRIPVSRTEDAVVKVVELDRAVDLQAETGLTTLALTLPPHSKREVAQSYRITAPRGFRLTPPREI